jgi:hypothetical protein
MWVVQRNRLFFEIARWKSFKFILAFWRFFVILLIPKESGVDFTHLRFLLLTSKKVKCHLMQQREAK